METIRWSETDQETLTLADIYADMGKNPDRTGDAAGGTHFHATTEDFLACLDSQTGRVC